MAKLLAGAALVSQASAFVAPGALRGSTQPNQVELGSVSAPAASAPVQNFASSGLCVVGAAFAAVALGSRANKRGPARATASAVVCRKAVKVGDSVPDVSLDKGFPPDKVSLPEFCKGKKVVLVGLPGAFTPTWSSTQVPGYLAKQDELKAKGVSDVIVYCVNDGAVMKAWAADQGTDGSIISMLGDPRSEVTNAMGLVLDHPGPMSVLGNNRCKRFSMLIDDGVIKTINVAASDDDPAGDDNPTVTLAEKMLEDL